MAGRGRIYHNFYTDELWEQVNKENKKIMEDFLQEYKQRKMSKGTISGYRNDLRIIMIYILRELDNRCVLDLKKKDFRNLSLYFTEECEMSAARTNRLKSAINSLLTFCEDVLTFDICAFFRGGESVALVVFTFEQSGFLLLLGVEFRLQDYLFALRIRVLCDLLGFYLRLSYIFQYLVNHCALFPRFHLSYQGVFDAFRPRTRRCTTPQRCLLPLRA